MPPGSSKRPRASIPRSPCMSPPIWAILPSMMPTSATSTAPTLTIRPPLTTRSNTYRSSIPRRVPDSDVPGATSGACISQGGASHLAGIVAHRLVHELERPGQLESHQTAGQVLYQLLFTHGLAKLHDGVYPLTQVLVGQPYHRARADGRVLLQRRLHLRRVDVGTPAQDQVCPPVGDVHVAVGVHPAEVAHRLPALLLACYGADVTIGRSGSLGAPHEDLPDLAWWEWVTRRIQDPDLAGDRATDRSAVREPLDPGDDGQRLLLGRAIELEDPLGPQPSEPGLFEPRGAWCSQVEDDLQ